MLESKLRGLRSTVDASSPTPLYEQVRLQLERWIEHHLEPDEELPTEVELVELFGVSRVTVRQAVRELLGAGKLYRPKPRSRLRRCHPRVHQQLTRLPGFFRDDLLAAGMDPEVFVLQATVARDERIAELLDVHADADLARVERLHTGNGQPMALQVSYLPLSLLPGFLSQDLSTSLFRLVADQYKLEITGASQRVFARECRAEEARALNLPVRAPALMVERVSYSATHIPIEFFRCCLRPDSYDLTLAVGDLAEAPGTSEPLPWASESAEPSSPNATE